MSERTPIYKYSFAEAKRNGDTDIELYRASHRANIACARAIEKAVSENFDGMHLNRDTAKGVISEYGIDRVMLLLANTLREKNYDGRFSHDNKDWGNSVKLPHSITIDNKGSAFVINSHPAILNGFIDMVRREYKDLNLWSGEHCISPTGLDFEGKIMVLKPEILKDEYKNPDVQLFYCSGGFGCSPTARGQSVLGQFLIDGETTYYRRSDFIGELKAELLPDWAKEKLSELKKPSIKKQLAAVPKQEPARKGGKAKNDIEL